MSFTLKYLSLWLPGLLLTIFGNLIMNGIFVSLFKGVSFYGHNMMWVCIGVYGPYYLALGLLVLVLLPKKSPLIMGSIGIVSAGILLLPSTGMVFYGEVSLLQKFIAWLEASVSILVIIPAYCLVGYYGSKRNIT